VAQAEPGFRGIVGRTPQESTPWWPEPVRPPAGAPHVVVVVFDDVGFSDFGCYGSEIATPTLDRLAAGGLRYVNFHTTALCSPTRACLLTGRDHHAVGMGLVADWDLGYPGYRGAVSRSAGTLAEMLRPHGYNTFAVGKWHLTPLGQTSPAGPFDQWPLGRGFDRFFGFFEGETNQWQPALVRDQHHVEPPADPGWHLSAGLVDEAIALLRDQRAAAPDRPFLLYLAFGACHGPHHAPAEYVERNLARFEAGWDAVRADRLARQLDRGLVPEGTALPPRNPDVRAWTDLSADERRLAVRLQAAYAGMLEHADAQLGRLVDFLAHLGVLDDTLLVVLSDNGASREGSPIGTVNALRFFNLEAPDLAQELSEIELIGTVRANSNYPLGWAMAGNTPLRWYKGMAHGGGVRDPLILHWPARIRDPGGLRRQFHHVKDLCPTILEAVGVAPPAELHGVAQLPVDGTSLLPTLDDASAPTGRRTQFFEVLGSRGIWHEGWKAVALGFPGRPLTEEHWELYHLDTDFTETHDLAAAEPERLRDMVQRWWTEAGRVGALPVGLLPWGGNPHARRRTRFELLAGTTQLPTPVAPDIRNRSYTLVADADIPPAGCEGVLVAHGDACGGYALFVRDGRLVFDHNFVGTHTVVASDGPLPTGRHELGCRFARTGDHSGTVTLTVDGAPVGEGAVAQTFRTLVSFEGFDVGCDRRVPVGDYVSPFAFTGTLHRVVVTLDPDQEADEAADLGARLRGE
jgi:arylsulfatase